jgi:hypothetical protein
MKNDLKIHQANLKTDIQVLNCKKCDIFKEIDKYKKKNKNIEHFGLENNNNKKIILLILIFIVSIMYFNLLNKK